MDEVWITGIGILSSLGFGRDEHTQALRGSVSGLKAHSFFNNRRPDPCISGLIPYEHLKYSIDESAGFRANLVLKKTVSAAIKNAGHSAESDLITGTTLNNIYGAVQYYRQIRNNEKGDTGLLRHFNPYSYQYSLKKELGISGRVKTIGSACGSGSAAIGSGYNRIRNGISRRVIAGGYEVLSPYIVAGFNSLMLLSKDRCKPFDKNRQGLNPGEGAAFLVLESAEGARKRGLKKPEFSIAGYGGALDSYHHTHAHPDGEGLASSISDAIMRAGISERDIDTIHFHGTATVVNDQSEYSACRKVFGNRLKQIPCFSTKSFTGHTFGASGAISTALSCFAASEDFAPGTLNCTKIDPEFRDLNVTEDIVTGIKSRYILITSLGFGGESFALILKKLKGVR